jgi:hypothetical protein
MDAKLLHKGKVIAATEILPGATVMLMGSRRPQPKVGWLVSRAVSGGASALFPGLIREKLCA